MCNRDAERRWAQMLISSEIDVRPVILTFFENKEGIHAVSKESRQFLFYSSSCACVCVGWTRQMEVRFWVVSCFLLGWPRKNYTAPGPAFSSWHLIFLVVRSWPVSYHSWALVNVCKMGENSLSSQYYLSATSVQDTDCLLYLSLMKIRGPFPQGTHCQAQGPLGVTNQWTTLSGQEMILICLFK